MTALAAFGIGTYLLANARSAPREWYLPVVAAVAYVASSAFLTAWAAETGTAEHAVLFGVAALGLVGTASWNAPGIARMHRTALGVASSGWEVVALVAATARFGWAGSESASVVLIAGAALATHGLLARRLLAVEAALVTWLVAGLTLIDEQIDLTMQATVILVSVVLLTVLEVERRRRRLEELPDLDVLHRAEWLLMIAPLAFAAYGMGDRLWFGLVLFAEGLLLIGWGAVTRIRRRAFIGFGGAVLAILLAIAIPTVRGVQEGLAGGTWLVIGAIAAVLFITVGSTIERRRAAIGRSLQQLGEILEDWE